MLGKSSIGVDEVEFLTATRSTTNRESTGVKQHLCSLTAKVAPFLAFVHYTKSGEKATCLVCARDLLGISRHRRRKQLCRQFMRSASTTARERNAANLIHWLIGEY